MKLELDIDGAAHVTSTLGSLVVVVPGNRVDDVYDNDSNVALLAVDDYEAWRMAALGEVTEEIADSWDASSRIIQIYLSMDARVADAVAESAR